MYIRKQWIDKSTFQTMSQKETLESIASQVRTKCAEGKRPVVIFDLDSTLFNVSNRSFQILKEWLNHEETSQFDHTKIKLSTLSIDDMEYSLEDVWEKKNIPTDKDPYKAHLSHAKQFWRKRFFSNHYVHHDDLTPGSREYVTKLYEMGATIVYLTGRDIPLMAFGTFDQLKTHGFPIEADRTRLILKPKRHLDDLDFKTGIAKTVSGWGEVVGNFENEPKNLVAMTQVLPTSTMNVFIESVSSEHPAPAGNGLYRIRNFL